MGVLVVLLCLAFGATAWAQEDSASGTDEVSAPTPDETDSEVPPRAETDQDGEDGTAESESPDVFIPTENISENISVKFPVDI